MDGRSGVSVLEELRCCVDLGGLLGGLRGCEGVSVSLVEGVGTAESCFLLFCLRFSLRLWSVLTSIAEFVCVVSSVEVWGFLRAAAGI